MKLEVILVLRCTILNYNLDSDLLNYKLPLNVYKRMGEDPYYIEVYLEAYNLNIIQSYAETLLANINENNFSEYKDEPYYLKIFLNLSLKSIQMF